MKRARKQVGNTIPLSLFLNWFYLKLQVHYI